MVAFYFDMTSCIGCKACQMACKDKNNLPIGTLYRTVSSYETGDYPMPMVYHTSLTCNHCVDPACVKNCPTGAMYKTEEGVVLHDDDVCIGCQTCVKVCPYGVPKYLEDKNITGKCDSCIGIRKDGGLPQCVSQCVGMAKYFGDLDADPSMLSFRGGYNTTLADCGREFTEADIHHLKDVGNGPSIVYILRDKKWQGGE